MRLRVLLLGGAGRFGSSTARRLAASEIVSEVGIAGRNRDALAHVASEIGDKARAVQVDIHDEERLASVVADYDIVVNAAGPEFEVLLPALRATISSGAHYCDIGGDGPTTERQLELESTAKDRDVVAVVGIGIDPGLTNLLAVQASRKFDRLEEVWPCTFLHLPTLWGGPPQVLDEIRKRGRATATWEALLRLASGPVCVYRGGRWMEVDPEDSSVGVTLPGGGTVTAYPVGTSDSWTLPRYLPGVRNVSNLWSLSPPQLNDLWLRDGRRISRGELNSADATRSFFGTVMADPDRWLRTPEGFASDSMSWVVATGWKDGRRARYTCWPLGPLYSTTIPLTVATLRILRGEVAARGVLPPEACFEPMPFFEEMASYAKAEDRDKPLLGERLEWLE